MRAGLAHIIVAIGLAGGACGKPRVGSIWFAEAGGIGARVFVDGKYTHTLTGHRVRGGALVNAGGWSPCYGLGDTIAGEGEEYVEEELRLPVGSHEVAVVIPQGDTLRGRAWVDDSPHFLLMIRCRTLWYPIKGGTAADSADRMAR